MLLTNEELVALIQEGTNVTENMGVLYQNFLPMIKKLAKDMKTFEVVDVEDYIQDSYFNLLKAAQAFKVDGAAKFSTYVYPIIRTGMFTLKQQNMNKKYYPAYLNRLMAIYQGTISSSIQELSDDELCKKMKIDCSVLQRVKFAVQDNEYINLDSFAPGTEQRKFEEILSDAYDLESEVLDNLEPDSTIEQKRNIVWGCVSRLEERKIAVIRDYYLESKNFEAIAKEANLTRSRIEVIHDKALKDLRKMPELNEIYYDYHSEALKGTGFNAWKFTGISSVERAVIKKIDWQKSKEGIKNQFEASTGILHSAAMPYVEKLPPKERQVIMLRYFEFKKIKEIVEIMGFSESYENRLRKKALLHLKQFWEKEGEKDESKH